MKFHQIATRDMKQCNKSKSKAFDGFKLSFAPFNVILAVILICLFTSINRSEAEIRIFTKPRFSFTILHGQLKIALESYAHRLRMEQFFVGS